MLFGVVQQLKLHFGEGDADRDTLISFDQPSQCSSTHGPAPCKQPSWSPLYFSPLIATQVSSRELAGKKLEGYKKREIIYEVRMAYLAKLFFANVYAKESIARRR